MGSSWPGFDVQGRCLRSTHLNLACSVGVCPNARFGVKLLSRINPTAQRSPELLLLVCWGARDAEQDAEEHKMLMRGHPKGRGEAADLQLILVLVRTLWLTPHRAVRGKTPRPL